MKKFLLVLCLVATAAIAGPPLVNGTVFAGINTMPEVILKNGNTARMSTARIEPFTTLIASQRTAHFLQDVVVTNLDTTGSVCLFLATYSQTCSALTNTCLNATLPGLVVSPGAARALRVTGEAKICAVASEANVDAQLERSMLYAN